LIIDYVDKKQHRNGIKRPKSQRYPSLKGVSSLLLDISNGKLLALQVPVLVQITESRYCIKDANKCDAHY